MWRYFGQTEDTFKTVVHYIIFPKFEGMNIPELITISYSIS